MFFELDGNKLYMFVIGNVFKIKNSLYNVQPMNEVIKFEPPLKLWSVNFNV